ncbi:hypothetical protein E2C01_057003 [Portunus trituberculatus]|uniref:Uncharacterized protein n=1 Tax=Portunus trituberculatus TaxID=210409 RepID=A0A5B7GYW0_PORTR|nr:hypothetical protein [Portunus trituberculatus]
MTYGKQITNNDNKGDKYAFHFVSLSFSYPLLQTLQNPAHTSKAMLISSPRGTRHCKHAAGPRKANTVYPQVCEGHES